jgi:plasmid stabilization system protein ParE
MNAPFEFTPQATEDLDAIWWFIAEDNRDAANRVETEIVGQLSPARQIPAHGNQAAGHNSATRSVLDHPEIP